jgi:hypothetical protein
MAKRSIPDHVKKEVSKIIDRFNREELKDSYCMLFRDVKAATFISIEMMVQRNQVPSAG